MKSKYIPKTEQELESWMKKNCFNFNSYSINGNQIYEGYGICKSNGFYIWYYTERGKKKKLNYFKNEDEIIELAFKHINDDKWAKTHLIGFSLINGEKLEIAKILDDLKIMYFQDEIPYLNNNESAYRTFVFGCDIKKVEKLKSKYVKTI